MTDVPETVTEPIRRPREIASGLAVVIAANLFLFAPFTLYTGNVDEFNVPLTSILEEYIWWACLALAGLPLPAMFLRGHRRTAWIAFLAALCVLLWLQGNILVWDYGVLDGRSIDWLDGLWRGVLDGAIWIGLILVALYGYQRFGKMLVTAAFATFGIQLILLVTAIAGGATGQGTMPVAAPVAEDREAVFRFSRENNVLHVVMDGFQADLFEEIVNDPANAELRDALEGFTFFRQNLGVYPYTEMTMPALVSGRIYRNEQPKADFVAETMRGHTILNAAKAAGYEVDIAASTGLRNVYARGSHDHSYAIANNQHVSERDYVINDAAKLADLSLFRLAPHFAKILVYNDQLWLVQARVTGEGWLQLQYFADLAFLEQFRARMSADRDVPVYKLLHLMLSHTPTIGDEDCGYDGRRATTRENVIVQATCGLRGVVDVLQQMRTLGVYDDSLIVLMADHGAWIEAAGFDGAVDDEYVNALTVGMALPVLAVKPRGTTHEFATSDAPTSLIDVPATIAALAHIDAEFDGRVVFDLEDDEPRQRTHMIYAYGENDEHPGYLNPLTEFAVDGYAFRASDWQRLGRNLPGGQREE